jgi:hypothetical protein
MDPKRKNVLDFCYVVEGGKSVPVKSYLEEYRLKQEHCGLVSLDHMKYMYVVYYDKIAHLQSKDINLSAPPAGFKGIVSDEIESNDVSTSSVPKGMIPEFIMYFNKEGYSSYCKDYKDYFDWVEKRNESRYNDNVQHGKGYDSKNLCHCFRLLEMASEIGRGQGIIVKRPNREDLLKIRRGEMDYDYLISKAEEMIEDLNGIYEKSNLPNSIDKDFANELLILIRKEFYNRI